MPTIAEAITLWVIISVIAAFLGASKIVIGINIFIVFMVCAGFFVGIGIKIFDFVF